MSAHVTYTCDLIQKKYKFTITGPSSAEAMKTVKDELAQADFKIHQIYPDGYSLDDPLLIAQLLETMLHDIARREMDRRRVNDIILEKFSLPSFLPDVFVADQLSIPTRFRQDSDKILTRIKLPANKTNAVPVWLCSTLLACWTHARQVTKVDKSFE